MSAGVSVRRVIVGTAGHIDHGKTTLVERLTGIRTDRLPEERERGMTIDVGYAELRLPDGTEVGLVDVPGHESLVRTMVAGATSMDVVLLVVAADDGPMLQTREHVDVLDLLGVRRALVALTKIDIAGPERTAVVEREVRALLQGTTIAEAPIVPVSSVTGEGLEQLKALLFGAVPAADVRGVDSCSFRMPVLRAFAVPGRGTVVTGVPTSGHLTAGQEIELVPTGLLGRVRSLQVHHRPAEEARAGHRTAVLVPDLPIESIERGMVLAAAGSLAPSARIGVRLRVLPHAKRPIGHAAQVRIHVGAADVFARVHMLVGTEVPPGATAAVELQGVQPFLVAPGDRFVVRTQNETDTIGGGVVVACLTSRLPRTEQAAAALLATAQHLDEPDALVNDVLARAGEQGVEPQGICLASGLHLDSVSAVLSAQGRFGGAVRLGQRLWFEPAALGALKARVLDALAHLHAAQPGLPFVALTALRAGLKRVLPAVLEDVLADLAATGAARLDGAGGIASLRHEAQLEPEQRKRCDRVLTVLQGGGVASLTEPELLAKAGLPAGQLKQALTVLEGRHEVLRVGPRYFDSRTVEQAKRTLASLGAGDVPFTPSQACQALHTTRRHVLPLLETLDRLGFTKRAGSLRTVQASK